MVPVLACFTVSHLSFRSALSRRARSKREASSNGALMRRALRLREGIVLEFRQLPYLQGYGTSTQIRRFEKENSNSERLRYATQCINQESLLRSNVAKPFLPFVIVNRTREIHARVDTVVEKCASITPTHATFKRHAETRAQVYRSFENGSAEL